jgi:hypothetical protein
LGGVDHQPCFNAPGHDGQLPGEANIWLKGVVYTRRSSPHEQHPAESGYRVSAAFKCGPVAAAANGGFRALYRRVRTLAEQAISEKKWPSPESTPVRKVLCHGWRNFGETNISTAFIMLEVRRSPLDCDEQTAELEPTEQDFLEPGGSSLDEIARLNPQRFDEFFNEFDFTESSIPESDLVTLSYGERFQSRGPLNFEPYVQRAEKQAERYRAFLKDQGETQSGAFKILQREWFLANHDFVTVHVCFER